jgi:pyridoxamine 5'-phosphate oxidase
VIEPDQPLLELTADPDPWAQFRRWFDEAAGAMANPEAMAAATADREGRPSVRMVLLKGWDERGFVFFTNYDSRKGHELSDNPNASLLFHWDPCGRQVRIEGSVERTSEAESDAYFGTRPRGSQVGARASRQSRPVDSREALDVAVLAVDAEFAGRPIPRPASWGGVRILPRAFEFWQHRDNRLHDRLRYSPHGDEWEITRLQP